MQVIVKIQIKNLLKEYDISLRELSRLTDIRHAALVALANQKRKNINIAHIKRIAEALGIDDTRKIIAIEIIDEE